jgi:Flp pilus assembly protein TadG
MTNLSPIRFAASDSGTSLAETALLLPFLLLLLVGAIDFGRGYYLAIQVAGAAQTASEYGSQKVTDIAGMQAAARNDAANVPGLKVSAVSYGCECSDGTSYSPNCTVYPTCTSNLVYRVSVTTSSTYSPLVPWPGIPSSILLSSTATMRGGAY